MLQTAALIPTANEAQKSPRVLPNAGAESNDVDSRCSSAGVLDTLLLNKEGNKCDP